MSADLGEAVRPVVEAFESLGVEYYLAGSVISSHFGVGRSTADVDVVARLRREHVAPLVAALASTYYVDEDAVLDAVTRRSMFNVIHLQTMLKVDVYVVATSFDESALRRRVRDTLAVDRSNKVLEMASPEDVVLHKLRWFRDGGQVSERQWNDIVGVLRVQRNLDLEHMRHWAKQLDVEEVLERALREASGDR